MQSIDFGTHLSKSRNNVAELHPLVSEVLKRPQVDSCMGGGMLKGPFSIAELSFL